jgi:hypothetical protein
MPMNQSTCTSTSTRTGLCMPIDSLVDTCVRVCNGEEERGLENWKSGV